VKRHDSADEGKKMAASGLWSPIYDRHLSWAGVRLEALEETDGGAPDGEVPKGKPLFAEAAAVTDDPAQWGHVLLTIVLSEPAGTAAFPALQAQGAQFALYGAEPSGAALCKTRWFDAAALPEVNALQALSRDEVRLAVYNLASLTQFHHCQGLGFSLFAFGRMASGGGAAAPQDTSRLSLMRLLALVAKDAETAEMEAVLKLEPKLAFDLLRLVNSTSFSMRTEITSFAQAIMVLGRRQLQRWLQLLLFAHRKDGDESPNILMQRAAERGRLLELLAGMGNDTVDREQAFMVGVFSLLDVLMATPLADLLKSVALPKPVELALLERRGRLGALLELAGAAEASDKPEVLRRLAGLGVAPGDFSRVSLDALSWALQVARLS